MANESLNGISQVIDLDIPQTLQEKATLISVVQEKDIAGTSEERLITFSPVIGQADDIGRCILLPAGSSVLNQCKSGNLWVDNGIPVIIVQPNLENSQIST